MVVSYKSAYKANENKTEGQINYELARITEGRNTTKTENPSKDHLNKFPVLITIVMNISPLNPINLWKY